MREPGSRVVVYGLWHLGSVTAACLSAAGHQVVGLDPDPARVEALRQGQPPLDEPDLIDRLRAGRDAGRLSFTTDPADALPGADVLWVTFDTPLDAEDRADASSVRAQIERAAPAVESRTLVLVSSQVPVGFTRALEDSWPAPRPRFAYSPENLRLGHAIESFERPERVVAGARSAEDRARLQPLFAPFTNRIEWMSVESAEMAKHAVNAFLATSVALTNELARLCEPLGADAKEVERALRTEPRIGPRAYVSPGAAFAGGTLARDVRFLADLGGREGTATPLLAGVLESNERHKAWLRDRVRDGLADAGDPVAAVLGLTYKAGTSTLRRSESVELCRWLRAKGVRVRAHDPAVAAVPFELLGMDVVLCATPREALAGADVAVVATEWPDYRPLSADDFLGAMRRPRVIDPGSFLAPALAADPRLTYVAAGRPLKGARP